MAPILVTSLLIIALLDIDRLMDAKCYWPRQHLS